MNLVEGHIQSITLGDSVGPLPAEAIIYKKGKCDFMKHYDFTGLPCKMHWHQKYLKNTGVQKRAYDVIGRLNDQLIPLLDICGVLTLCTGKGTQRGTGQCWSLPFGARQAYIPHHTLAM